MKKYVIPTFFTVCLLFFQISHADDLIRTMPDAFPRKTYAVEKLEAYAHDTNIMVNGVIRNTGANDSRGYVIVYFADDNDAVVASQEAEVNGGLFLSPGQQGSFEVSVNLDKQIKIKRTYVEYVERDKKIRPVIKTSVLPSPKQ